MADGSTRVVYAALIGNALVALSKFGAATVSGSSAMFTEALHSSADMINQMLLLFGNRRSRRAPDDTHPFGYGMEVYFWTFAVAVIVLLAGGVASVWEGVTQLRSGGMVEHPALSLCVLALSGVFEGGSFAVGYREFKRTVRRHSPRESVGLWRFIALSKDPNLYESLLEDAAALIGLAIAAAGVIASAYLHMVWADGIASIGIGALLIADSFVILAATRSLSGGEAVAPALERDLRAALDAAEGVAIDRIATLHLGPRTIVVTLTVLTDPARRVGQLRRDLARLEERLKSVDDRVTYVFFRF